jgi:hydrogenase maturation protein HypF
MNSVLADATAARLKSFNFFTLRHSIVPPNDGGISLGQLAVAARQLSTS